MLRIFTTLQVYFQHNSVRTVNHCSFDGGELLCGDLFVLLFPNSFDDSLTAFSKMSFAASNNPLAIPTCSEAFSMSVFCEQQYNS